MFHLIVGLNAAGKARLVDIIANFAKTLAGKISYLKVGKWNLEFRNPGSVYSYRLEINNSIVLSEEIIKDKKVLLQRQQETAEESMRRQLV